MKPFLWSIQSLKTCSLRDRNRYLQKWVSRLVSRPSLKTPSPIIIIN